MCSISVRCTRWRHQFKAASRATLWMSELEADVLKETWIRVNLLCMYSQFEACNAMLHALGKQGEVERLSDLYRSVYHGSAVTAHTFATVLSALGHCGQVERVGHWRRAPQVALFCGVCVGRLLCAQRVFGESAARRRRIRRRRARPCGCRC